MSFLDRILACRHITPSRYRPLRIDGATFGWVTHDFAAQLARFPDVFAVEDGGVELQPRLQGFEARTEAVAGALEQLAAQGVIDDWRGEAYPVVRQWGEEPVLRTDRGVMDRLGLPAFGVHLNGFVDGADGLRMWIGRRSRDAHTAPGGFDHVVAGGQPLGLSLEENLAKECDEEASIPAALAARALPAGLFAYRFDTPQGLKNNTVFAYDLELPADFVPENRDGEVEAFELWPVARVMDVLRETEDFKFNVGPVILGFLIRRGILRPHEPGYVDLVRALGEVPSPGTL